MTRWALWILSQRGGFAVHPVTGDLWGIEALQSQAPVLYTIDRTTGLADSILRLGIGGVEAPQEFGFDALHILDDGTFIAARGGNAPADSVIWEITSDPDPISGLAEIAVIPLPTDSLIVGNLNGFEAPPGAEELLVAVDCDNLEPVRAEELECTATASDTQGSVSFAWVFRPDSITVFPGQDAPRLLPVRTSPVRRVRPPTLGPGRW